MENGKIVKIARPEGRPVPVVFDSPHSGRGYPADFGHACAQEDMERAEDSYVDDLFSGAVRHGASFLCALFPRTYIDPNRAADDIDPQLLDGPWPGRAAPTARSHAGIGLVRRLLRPGLPLYGRKLSATEIARRIGDYYEPYHAALQSLLDEAHRGFGAVWHVNCHAMPSAAGGVSLPDFVLGDRNGTSCAPAFTGAVRDFIRGLGYSVAVNSPYKGVEIVRRHGRPAEGRHSLQIEVGKALYWDERKNEKTEGYEALRADLEKLSAHIAVFAENSLP